MGDDKYVVLMAGVVPPPVHGASLATRALFDADLSPVSKVLLEIRSSNTLESVGKPSLGKGLGMLALICRCLWLRMTRGPRVLYYTPGSAAVVPFVRDVLFLGLCRPWFSRTVLHYHSGGLPEFIRSGAVKQILGKWIYGRGAWSVGLSRHTPVPGADCGASREFEVANGMDVPAVLPDLRDDDEFRILFVGNLYEDKGVLDLLAASMTVAGQLGRIVRLRLVGRWPDQKTRLKFEAMAADAPASLRIDPPSACYGDEKWEAFANADVFVFPSFYRSENFPLVLIEALACGLPVVATRWRGIPSIIEDGVSGLLVEPRDRVGIAANLVRLALDPDLRTRMGRSGREAYLCRMTLEAHVGAMRAILMEACEEC